MSNNLNLDNDAKNGTKQFDSANFNDSEGDESEGKTIDSCNENVAIIHVIDETKFRKQDFKWSINKLLKHMKYFEKSINGCEDKIGLDISVHWDLDTFEWLIKYIHLDKPIVHRNGAEEIQKEVKEDQSKVTKTNGECINICIHKRLMKKNS